MPFPLLFPALALVAGIVASSVFGLPARAAFAGTALSLIAAWIFYFARKNRAAFAFALCAVLFIGAGWTSFREARYEANSLHALKLEDYADFYGTLARSPSREFDRDVLVLKVDRVRHGDREFRVRGNLRITVPRSESAAAAPPLLAGDRVKISARISAGGEFNNFNAPFYGRFLRSRDVHNRAFTKSPRLIEKDEAAGNASWLRPISALRQSLEKRLETFFPGPPPAGISPEGAVLEALLLGNDGRMAPETTASLQKTGLYHLFAISGAHIAIISFLLFSLLRLVRVPERTSCGILAVILVFYALLVEGSPSVLRAVIMALAFLLGKLAWKDVHLINTIAMSALVLLMANPFSLFDAGFQLTFAATLSIIFFYPKVMKFLPNLPLRISELTALSITASLGVLPIIVRDFNRVTFASLVLNYAAVPLVSLVMGAGYLFLPVSAVLPWAAKPIAAGLAESVRVFDRLSRLLDPIGFISYRIPTPPDFVMAGYFLFLLLWLVPRRFKGQRLYVFAGFAVFFGLLITYPFSSRSPDLRITVLDVGQGDSILVEFLGSRKMLIDGGGFPESRFDVGERIVSPFLWRKGIKKIDILVLTHAHPDHLNGLPAVARNFRIGEFWEADRPADDPVLRDLETALGSRVPRKEAFRGFSRTENGVRIESLHPPDDGGPAPRPAANDRSIALRLTYGTTSFLLPGDIGKESEAGIMAAYPEIRSQVLKSPHHGSSTSSSEAFLAAVAPRMAVVTVGESNRYGLPQEKVLEAYSRAGARVFRTDRDGAVEFRSDGRVIRVRTAASTPTRPGD
ncbi:MAG: DNA internalization-related competence protein ComEC/Rec2 [Candidatus Aminicenantales bacterium]